MNFQRVIILLLLNDSINYEFKALPETPLLEYLDVSFIRIL